MKNTVRLTESQLHKVIKETVKRVINEIGDTPYGQYQLGRLAARQGNNGNYDASHKTSQYASRNRNTSNSNGANAYENGEFDQIYHDGNKNYYNQQSSSNYQPHPQHKFKTRNDKGIGWQ